MIFYILLCWNGYCYWWFERLLYLKANSAKQYKKELNYKANSTKKSNTQEAYKY